MERICTHLTYVILFKLHRKNTFFVTVFYYYVTPPSIAGEKSGIGKRYFHHTKEIIDGHPEVLDPAMPSLSARLHIAGDAVSELAAAAAVKAIAEWADRSPT